VSLGGLPMPESEAAEGSAVGRVVWPDQAWCQRPGRACGGQL